MEVKEPEIYLGDGVYCRFDGYQFCLSTTRGTDIHRVFLPIEELTRFFQFVAKTTNIEIIVKDKRNEVSRTI